MPRKRSIPSFAFIFTVALCSVFAALAGPAHAQDSGRPRFGAGGHFGVGLDDGSPMLGADFLVDVLDISPRVTMSVWPSYSHVFFEDAPDVNLLDVNLPFQIHMRTPVVRPFAAPGLGLAFAGGGTTLKLNLTGGCIFRVTEHIEPFTALTVRMIQGTYVDLLVGMLFRF
jgi:hypothetical protein